MTQLRQLLGGRSIGVCHQNGLHHGREVPMALLLALVACEELQQEVEMHPQAFEADLRGTAGI